MQLQLEQCHCWLMSSKTVGCSLCLPSCCNMVALVKMLQGMLSLTLDISCAYMQSACMQTCSTYHLARQAHI